MKAPTPKRRLRLLLLLFIVILLLWFSLRLCSAAELSNSSVARREPRSSSKASWADDILLLGDATLTGSSISLTKDDSTCSGSAGRALYSLPIHFLDPVTRTAASFSTRFTFLVTTPNSMPPLGSGGDGLAFLITTNPYHVCTVDGHMGLFCNNATAEIDQVQEAADNSVAVEFDTNLDSSLGDINSNHVALDAGSIFSVASADAGRAGVNLQEGQSITAWVEYNATSDVVRVWVSYSTSTRPSRPLIRVAGANLSEHFQEQMYVGFSASCNRQGRGVALHTVQRWRFKTYGFVSFSLTPPAGSSVGGVIGGGIGLRSECWTSLTDSSGCRALHQDLIATLPSLKGSKSFVLLGVYVGVPVALILLMMICYCWVLTRRRNDAGDETFANWRKWIKWISGGDQTVYVPKTELVPARLSLHTIEQATEGFHRGRVRGNGVHGVVYEGVLSPGCSVAVKRFKHDSHYTDVFGLELAAVLGSTRHRNLVPLKGWCCEQGELLLVYEYMSNGDLHKLLHPKPPGRNDGSGPSSPLLTWEKRKSIVLGVASALAFLHDECEKKIIHRDVKANNVLLDGDLNARLGDFGLADLNDHGSVVLSTLAVGTMGYLAPEYVHSGVPTEKSDVYSFGILALEVATGRRPLERGVALIDWVWEFYGRGNLTGTADQSLGGNFSAAELCRMLVVGLACGHPDCTQRPTMKKAIRMLKGESPLAGLPLQKPPVNLQSLSHPHPHPPPENGPVCPEDSGDHYCTPCASFSNT